MRSEMIKKGCFGRICPDLSRIQFNETLAGKVFLVRINSLGMMRQAPQPECDLA